MSNDYFQFKHFLVNQDRSAFKVGTDSVLLGAWADVSGAGTILDIGTGTGLLALMLAQKCGAHVTGIETDEPSYHQAVENASQSPWSDRISILHISLQEYLESLSVSASGPVPGSVPEHFDIIISNPPYFRDSLKSGNRAKDIARHDTSLPLDLLVNGVNVLLAPKGKFCLVLPSERYEEAVAHFNNAGLHLCRELSVKSGVSLSVRRYLLEFRRTVPGQIESKGITIEKTQRHDYTDEYRELTRDYYLAF